MALIYSGTIFFYLLSTASYLAYLIFQKKGLDRIGLYLIITGLILHSTAISYVFFLSGNIPARNLHETLSMAGWAVVCAFLILQYKFNLKILGVYAASLAAFVMIISFLVPNEPAAASDVFKSLWLLMHIVFIFMGDAALAMACGVGILYLLQEHAIKTKRHGFFFRRLPSLDFLDSIGYVCIIAGFTLLTVGLITGFVYAKAVWGKFWSADPKEIWSIVTWLIYAALLHERLTVGWRGRRAAIMAIIGFAAVLFTFFGVNFFLTGHHEAFTRW